MKKIFLVALIAAATMTSCKEAQTEKVDEVATTATEVVGDIAFVNTDMVLAESEIFKTEGLALNEKTQKAQNSWAQKEKNLQYEATQLQEKYSKGLITTADAQKKQAEIEKKIANYQTTSQKEAQALDEENIVFSNRSQDLIMRAIQAINEGKKYKMIVNATALLDAAEGLDISDAVLAKMNELYAADKAAETASK